MRTLFLRSFLPLSLLASVVSFWHALSTGANLETAVVLPAVAAFLMGMVAERFVPYRADWSRPRRDMATDLASAVLLLAVLDPMLKWLGHFSMPAQPLFPVHWPLALQVILAALLAEFGSYWAHRLHHQLPALWQLHAFHHESERLYTLNNFRLHPLNYVFNYLLGIVPLLMFGVPQAAIYGYFAVTLPVLVLQHANLPLQNGWLNYVFSTNEVHRWHHSNRAGEGDSNFGRTLVVWDQLFGTYRNQPANNHPVAVGLYVGSSYKGQWRCCLLY